MACRAEKSEAGKHDSDTRFHSAFLFVGTPV